MSIKIQKCDVHLLFLKIQRKTDKYNNRLATP